SEGFAAVEVGDSYNSVTNRTRRGFFGIGCHRASPRPVAFLGPRVAKRERPFFRGALIAAARRNADGLSPIFSRSCRDSLPHPPSPEPSKNGPHADENEPSS